MTLTGNLAVFAQMCDLAVLTNVVCGYSAHKHDPCAQQHASTVASLGLVLAVFTWSLQPDLSDKGPFLGDVGIRF